MNKWQTTNPWRRLELIREEKGEYEVNPKTITFAEIIVDYFQRWLNCSIFVAPTGYGGLLIEVTYRNRCVQIYPKSEPNYYFEYLFCERLTELEEEGVHNIEYLPSLTEWLKSPPSWITRAQEKERLETLVYDFYGFFKTPTTKQHIIRLIQEIKEDNLFTFKHPLELQEYWWRLYEYLES